MKVGTFEFFLPTRIFFGVKTFEKLGYLSKSLGKKALIVTGKHSTKASGLLDRAVKLLDEAGIRSVIFDKVIPNPISTTVDEGAEIAKREGCDFVIGLGGGSSIDSAKMIAAVVKSGGNCWDYMKADGGKEPKEALPIVAIPTTHGTGTEADPFAVITNPESHEKPGVGFDSIFPTVSIVDPELMLTLPPKQTAATGMDAFYHSLESYLNIDHQPASDLLALEAISLINHYLPVAYEDGRNLEARTALAWASTAAGICETLSGCIANHSLEHPLSGHYNITHGVGLCAIGPSFIEYIQPHVKERLARVALALGAPESIVNDEELSRMGIELLRKLQRSVDLEISLKELEVKRSDLKHLAEEATRIMGSLIEKTPGNLTIEDLEKIYENAF